MKFPTVEEKEPTKEELQKLCATLMKFNSYQPKLKRFFDIENKIQRNSMTGELYLEPDKEVE